MSTSQFAVYQLKKKPELRNLLFRTYEELAKDQIPVQMENYEQVYLGTMKPGETPEQIKKELEKKQPHNYKGHAVSTSDVLILNDKGVMTIYYVNKDTFIEISDFMKGTSSEGGGLAKDTVGYEIAGKDGTWEVIDYLLVEGKNYFLMEHEQYGKDVAYVVLDQKGNVIVDSTYNGFDDVVKQKILDSLHPPVQEQAEDYKPKLDNWQKYMENGEYLRSAEITEEANYNMIDGLKNNAAPKDKKNRPKESVLAKLNEKKEEIARQSTREISKRLYCSPSSIIRLCQKLGFTGFEEFKEMYVEELHYLNSNFSDINPSIPFMTEDNIQTISNKMCSLYHEIIDDTHSLLDHDMLRKSLNLLKNNKNIYIISSGSQNDLALTFRDKMARIGKHVNIYQHIDEPYYEACYLNKGDACFILISYTGETQNCIRMANKLNERNIDFITITSFGTNTLSSLSRCVLHVSTREKIRNNLGTFSMNLSTLYLLDLLYSMYFSLNYKENKKKKIKIADEYENFTSSLIRDTSNDLIK